MQIDVVVQRTADERKPWSCLATGLDDAEVIEIAGRVIDAQVLGRRHRLEAA